MKLRSDNIGQFFVTERDALTFPILSVVSWVGNYQSKWGRPTIVMDEYVDGITDVLDEIGTMRERQSLP